MSSLLEDYKAYLKGRKAPLTSDNYLHTIDSYIYYLKGEEPNTQNVQRFLIYMEVKGNGPRSLNRHLSALKSFFKFTGKELIVEGYSFPKMLPDVPTVEEVESILAAIQTPLEKALIYTFLKSGIRLSELCNIDRKRGIIYPVPQDSDGRLRVMGKGRKERLVRIKPDAVAAIKEYMATRTDNDPRVFSHHRTVYQDMVREIGERVGLKLHPHLLRHTYGTRWIEGGGSLSGLKEQMGHSSTAVTDVYVHLNVDRIKVPDNI